MADKKKEQSVMPLPGLAAMPDWFTRSFPPPPAEELVQGPGDTLVPFSQGQSFAPAPPPVENRGRLTQLAPNVAALPAPPPPSISPRNPYNTVGENMLWAAKNSPALASSVAGSVVNTVADLGKGAWNAYTSTMAPAQKGVVDSTGKFQPMTPDEMLKIQQQMQRDKAVSSELNTDPAGARKDSPAEIAAGADAGRRLALDFTEHDSTYQDELTAAANKMAAQSAAQRAAMDLIQEQGIQGLQQAKDRMKAVYTKADLEMAKLKIDPNRWEKETPAFTQALMLVAAGAFGFITKGKAANPILSILDRAINKDVEAQMQNYDLALKRTNLKIRAAEDDEYARQKMVTAMWNRALHGLNAIQENGKTELAIIQAKAAMEQAQMRYIEERQKMYSSAWNAENKRSSTDAEKELNDTFQGIGKLETLQQAWGKTYQNRGARWFSARMITPGWNTDSENYENIAKGEGLILAKAVLGGNVSNLEGGAIVNMLPNVEDSEEQAQSKMWAMVKGIERNLLNNWQRMSPGQRARMAPVMEQNAAALEAFKEKLRNNGRPTSKP